MKRATYYGCQVKDHKKLLKSILNITWLKGLLLPTPKLANLQTTSIVTSGSF